MSARHILLAIPLMVFALVLVVFAVGLTRDPSRIPSELIDRPLPEFVLPPLDGYEQGLSSADITGEVALVNIFGSWCTGCVVEHGTLMAIAATGGPPIYGLAWRDDPVAAARWLARRGDPYAAVGADMDGRVAIEFGVTGAPETFVIDRTGRIRYKHVGPITQDIWRRVLQPLVAELEAELESE